MPLVTRCTQLRGLETRSRRAVKNPFPATVASGTRMQVIVLVVRADICTTVEVWLRSLDLDRERMYSNSMYLNSSFRCPRLR